MAIDLSAPSARGKAGPPEPVLFLAIGEIEFGAAPFRPLAMTLLPVTRALLAFPRRNLRSYLLEAVRANAGAVRVA